MNNSYKNHICIVFAQEHYNPLGLIRCLGENGIYPVYISVKRRGEVATKSKYISELHRVDSVPEGLKLLIEKYGSFDYEYRPFVLFSDDKTVGYCNEFYDDLKNKFIFYNAGRAGRINQLMNKYYLMQLARKYGFNVLDSYVVKGEITPENLIYPVITKDVSSNVGAWKSDVFICNNEEELKAALHNIKSPEILIQHFVDKKNEYALEGFAVNKGRDIHICTAMTWKYLISGYYSPYHDVTMFKNAEMEARLRRLFEELEYEGIFEVEFIIDKNSEIYFLEINFRASAWNYTTSVAGMPISYLWVKSMLNGFIDENDKIDFDDFTSMSEIIDYGKRVDGGIVSFAEWLKDFKEAKCTYYYNKNDIGPWEYVADKWDEYK